MNAQEIKDVGSQELEQESKSELEPQSQLGSEHQDEKESESEDEANIENADGDGNDNEKIDEFSPRGILDLAACSSVQVQGTLWTATTVVVHKALTPENYVLPFKGLIDAVRNSSVKKLSTSTLALITGYDLSKRAVRHKLARIRTAEDAIECGLLRMKKRSWRNFEFDELASATDNFNPASDREGRACGGLEREFSRWNRLHHEPDRRPHMNRVVELLKGEGRPMDMKQCSIQPRSMLIDSCNEDHYTSSNYLKDLNRHKELLME